MNNKEYVSPPNNKTNIFSKLKGIYSNTERDYLRSLIFQQIILSPLLFFANFIIFGLIIPLSLGLDQFYTRGFADILIGIIIWIIVILLTTTGIIFYPYTIYWYTRSSFYRFFDNLYIFGGLVQVIVRKLLILLAHLVIAGLLSPIIGIMTWRKLKRENITIVKNNS